MTTPASVGSVSNMKAVQLARTRVVYSQAAFAELVLWRIPEPLAGSEHPFKYRLAYVVGGECVLRFDNEAGKGDHCHFGDREQPYEFTTVDQLIADFQQAITRWNHEHPDA